ncbi:hypothetical protein TCAL_09819 [Tigriopus californicus]|uniref:Tetraspanin n=1 Tax=Tigriopus californicus TaxID=6832 RepID=A0A553PQC1_TIGCA|nr:tetraspanin-9-like [Tigriopus californicus]TRY79873.1 hypothetical protein TCAL_09819 [Tigriopus californicus]|eukprot:TCALIF_09819-PA protein Name:"Similar to tspan9 Tetraspanin-9 (Salmo salar)" AED:0.05 eAED:0.05 QI:136/1/1/1/0.4/0.5/6/60/246
MDNCCSSIIKYLLFIANFLVFVVGIVVLAFSVIAYLDGGLLNDLFSDLDNNDVVVSVFSTASILLMTISVIVILASFFGCCGAIKESKCLLTIYMVILVVAVGAVIAGAVLGYDQDANIIENGLTESLTKYQPDGESNTETSWDSMQKTYECCGVSNYTNWVDPGNFPVNDFKVPASCCQDRGFENVDDCRRNPGSQEWADKLTGCYGKLETLISNNQEFILWGCIGILVVMILNLAAAFVTCCNV